MKGSEKQIKWAKEIKAEVMPMLMSMRDVIEESMLTTEEVKTLDEEQDASFWIELFKYPTEEKVFIFLTRSLLHPKIKKFLNETENRERFMR